jgi:diguanylate cyclase (GGDEF)-like protein/PAS domain S-box-containing protein
MNLPLATLGALILMRLRPLEITATLAQTGYARLLALLCMGILTTASAIAAQPREVRVGVYQNAPKIFMDSQGQPSGILGDLLVEIARDEGWTLRAQACEWQACLQALQEGQLDLLPDVAFSDERAVIFDFHKVPSLLSWSQIYKRKGVTLNSALELQGKRIAVLTRSVQESYLALMLSSFGLQAELVPVQTLQEGFELVRDGKADAAAANRFFGDQQAPAFTLESTSILFQPVQLFYATARGRNGDLLRAVDIHLQEWVSNSESHYFTVLKRWMNTAPQFTIPKSVWWALGSLGTLFAAAIGLNLFLRREVNRQTINLKSSEDRLATILNSVDAFIYIKDPQLRYQYANRKVCDLFGLPMEQVIGKTDAAFFDAATVIKLQVNDRRVVEAGERVEDEEHNRSADGGTEQVFRSIKLPLRRDDGSIYGLCGISTDITRHKAAEEAIHQLAFYDPLTQLPNRRLLMERLQHALQAHSRDRKYGALLFIDVDNFKDLNDTQGHMMGDELLRQIGQRLRVHTRQEDTLARQGGDEFVVMLQGLSTSSAEAVDQVRQTAQKLLDRLGASYELEGHPYDCSVSIGVAMFSAEGSSRDELLKQADLAMYQAKSAGRNTVRFFDPQMQALVRDRTAMEADLRRSLVNQDFLLYYQPQVDSHGTTLGVEALVRWQHPERGLVPPAQFIPVAEGCNLILPLGDWILHTACHQLVAWAQDPVLADRIIAVNVSAKQFRQSNFVDRVIAALTSTGARANRLELELTESQLVDDVDEVIAKMSALKALGVRLSLDDFGTGYSSLSMLKRLPLDQLKIDQSFVRDIHNPQDASIVQAIVALGASLHLDVIAEGVETQGQRDVLMRLGCHHFQGYLFGRPAPV